MCLKSNILTEGDVSKASVVLISPLALHQTECISVFSLSGSPQGRACLPIGEMTAKRDGIVCVIEQQLVAHVIIGCFGVLC